MMFIGFLILIVVLWYLFGQNIAEKNRNMENSKETALEILDEKLAKGEISTEEYLRKKELILKDG